MGAKHSLKKLAVTLQVSAVAVKDKLEGHRIIVFCSTGSNQKKNIQLKINNQLYKNFGSFALPKKVYFLSSLPKTRSGKIIRRVLREILDSPYKKISDISTILNKRIIYEIRKKIIKDINI